MGTYMKVVLKEHLRFDAFAREINKILADRYGASISPHFNTWEEIQIEADYLNKDPEGRKQMPDWKRPITKEQLHASFFWMRMGEFSCKLSGEPTTEEARDAIAVCKWINNTEGQFIDKKQSENYSKGTVAAYLNPCLKQKNINISELWAMPEQKVKK